MDYITILFALTSNSITFEINLKTLNNGKT